ncbi:hypothetical protein CAAN1_33S00672 [[Candida] anglica]|uniref:RecA family profile 1 domain-containing protein n=1 Tax=[Candida] anglica TaxID=148631 RepID=A0ABP0E9H3_9ASCO
MDLHSQVDVTGDGQHSAINAAICAHGLTTLDLLSSAYASDRVGASSQLAKRLGRSIREVDTYLDTIKDMASSSVVRNDIRKREIISTGLPTLDEQLGGGIRMGEITEVFGASGSGKSQFLLNLTGKQNSKCVYISTESTIETRRLESMASDNINIMDKVYCVYCPDLESQDHIIQTQLPVLLENDVEREIKLVIIDSISHHLRREDAISNVSYLRTKISEQEMELNAVPEYADIKAGLDAQHGVFFKGSPIYRNISARTLYVLQLYRSLQQLASKYNLAIVVANQVSDKPDTREPLDNPLSYEMQLGHFAGWDISTILSHQGRAQNSNEEIKSTYAELLQSLDTNKRTKLQDHPNGDFDPRYASKTAKNLSQSQTELLDKLHNATNCTTKKYLPALGYQWTRRITARILLMKTYKPKISMPSSSSSGGSVDPETGLTYDQLMAGFNMPDSQIEGVKKRPHGKDTNQRVDANTLAQLVEGWNIERYARVVSSPYTATNSESPSRFNKIPFEISTGGIHEGLHND